MMEFLAANFNLPTIIVAAIVFGCVGWITWHSHKHGGGCGGGARGVGGRRQWRQSGEYRGALPSGHRAQRHHDRLCRRRTA
mgnify:CR=1 FL=1